MDLKIRKVHSKTLLSEFSLLEKRLWHRCFPVSIAKFLRTTILKNICHRPFMLIGSVQSNLNACPILNVCYDWHLFCNFLFMIFVCKSNHFNLWWYDKANIIWGNYRSLGSFLFVVNKVWHSLMVSFVWFHYSRCFSWSYRSSHQRCSIKKSVLRNLTKFTGKHLCQRIFFNKIAGLRPLTLLKKRLWHRCFPVNFAKFLRTPFLQSTSGGCF